MTTFILAGQVIVGTLPSTVTVNEHVAVLLLASVTLKVLVVIPGGNNRPLGDPVVWVVTALGQLSVPTGVGKVINLVHVAISTLAIILAGHTMTGSILSTTVTVKLHVDVLLLWSVTLNVFVVTPTGKIALLGSPAICIVTEFGQLSVPIGAV